MTQPDTDTIRDLAHVAGHLEEMWGRLLGGGAPGGLPYVPPAFRPPADVYQTAADVVVVLEVPGLRNDDVDVQIEGRRLAVRGHRRDRRGADERRVYSAMEIPFGSFERLIVLPADVDAEAASASYRDGLLQIMLPKRPREPGRRVRVIIH